LHRVIVHGLLHVIGYDDVTEWKQRRMRAAENRALKLWELMLAAE
jgi:ssRNA-specific RNase YbeY (16S rRNA maturation enzyme)